MKLTLNRTSLELTRYSLTRVNAEPNLDNTSLLPLEVCQANLVNGKLGLEKIYGTVGGAWNTLSILATLAFVRYKVL